MPWLALHLLVGMPDKREVQEPGRPSMPLRLQMAHVVEIEGLIRKARHALADGHWPRRDMGDGLRSPGTAYPVILTLITLASAPGNDTYRVCEDSGASRSLHTIAA